jgi:hypothetical protein
MASRWHAPSASRALARSGADASARTPVRHVPTGFGAMPTNRASSSLAPGRESRSRSTNATAVASEPSVFSDARRAGPSCGGWESGDAVQTATGQLQSRSSSVRRSPLDSFVSSDQALHAARRLGNFGDRQWGSSVIGSSVYDRRMLLGGFGLSYSRPSTDAKRHRVVLSDGFWNY